MTQADSEGHNEYSCSIGEIRPYRGEMLSLLHLICDRQHLETVQGMVASIPGFYVIGSDDRQLICAFEEESLPRVLRLANGTSASMSCRARLSDADVLTIRREHEQGLSQRKLAERHSVSLGVVSKIINRRGCYSSAV